MAFSGAQTTADAGAPLVDKGLTAEAREAPRPLATSWFPGPALSAGQPVRRVSLSQAGAELLGNLNPRLSVSRLLPPALLASSVFSPAPGGWVAAATPPCRDDGFPLSHQPLRWSSVGLTPSLIHCFINLTRSLRQEASRLHGDLLSGAVGPSTSLIINCPSEGGTPASAWSRQPRRGRLGRSHGWVDGGEQRGGPVGAAGPRRWHRPSPRGDWHVAEAGGGFIFRAGFDVGAVLLAVSLGSKFKRKYYCFLAEAPQSGRKGPHPTWRPVRGKFQGGRRKPWPGASPPSSTCTGQVTSASPSLPLASVSPSDVCAAHGGVSSGS